MIDAESLEREFMGFLQRRINLEKSLFVLSFPRDEARIRKTNREIRSLQAKSAKLLTDAKKTI